MPLESKREPCWFCCGKKQILKLGILRDCHICNGEGDLPPRAAARAIVIRKCACGQILTGERVYVCTSCLCKKRLTPPRHPERCE